MSVPPKSETVADPAKPWSIALLWGFREGEPDALRTIYRAYVDDVARHLRYGFSFSSGGRPQRFAGYSSPSELHDALHETFRRAFEPRARHSYDGERPYGPYLRTIARNVVMMTFRRDRRTVVEVQEDKLAAAPAQADPEGALAREQVRCLVQAFLATLDTDDKALLELRFVNGTSQRDAAIALGLGRQQVRSREAKLRRALVAYLAVRGESGVGSGLLFVVVGMELAVTLREGLS